MAKKIAYLTIDDGPSKDMKQKVDFLLSKKVPAIWFSRGDFLEKRPKEAIYAIKKGFIIGNHSYNHPYFSKLPLNKCFKQIEKTDEIIDSLYRQAGKKRQAKVFRFPYGDKGGGENVEKGWPEDKRTFIQAIQNFLKKLGYKQPLFEGIKYKWFNKAGLLNDIDVYWTYDVMEWAIKEKAFGIDSLRKVFERMDENYPEQGRGLNFAGSNEIILIHDHFETTKIFIPIIKKLITKGIKFDLPKFQIK